MAFDADLYRAVESEYEAIRRQNEIDLAERRARVFSAVPEIEALDSEIKGLGLKLYKIALSGGDVEKNVRALRVSQKELLKKRDSLLTENGFLEDALSEQFQCPACRDTGAVGTAACECYKRKLILKAYEQSNLSRQLEDQSFETFDLSMYSDETLTEYGITARANMKIVLSTCKAFAARFPEGNKSLLFWGAPGLGKTFLSTCIAKELIKKGYSVIYETAYQTFSMLEELKFKRSDDEKLKFKADKLYSCDLLILDDLGSEFSTQYTTAALFDILNSRLIAGKKTVINTNLTAQELEKKYSERVMSRIIGHYDMLHFVGNDIRFRQSGL
ncbi:MAG: ATP-binding protein [Clostridia bacterium]|nr:ATP-binding protein [Clostridia bacterium]